MNKRALITAFIAAAMLCAGALTARADDGSITGTVKYGGTAPKPKSVDISKDKEVCGLKPHFEEDLIVGSDGGIANAVDLYCRRQGRAQAGDGGFRSERMRLCAARSGFPGRQHGQDQER